MYAAQMLFPILYRLSGLALCGLLVVMLAGPFLAVVGTLLAFAVIGAVFWLPIRFFLLRRPIDWTLARATSRKYAGRVAAGCGRIGSLIPDRETLVDRSRQAGLLAATICREVTCGTLVGALLGLIPGLQGSSGALPVIFGGCFGACAGTVVAMATWNRARGSAAVPVIQPVDGSHGAWGGRLNAEVANCEYR